MSEPLNVLISGSGIAGAVFAWWLLRAYPAARITIVERDRTLRLTGASVDIRSSAVDIIKWMGVEPEIRAQTTREEGMQFVKENGKPIATFLATGRTDVQSMTSEYEIFRGALAKIFLEPIMDQVDLIFNESVQEYEQHDGDVDVTFTQSRQTKRYDLLVACDGLGSRIRGKILNAKPREQIHDEGVHAAYFTIKRDLLDGSRLAKWYNTTRGRSIFIRPDPDPRGRVRGHFIKATPKGDVETRARYDEAMEEGHESYMGLLEEEFQDAGWLAPEVLQGMRESDDFYCSIFGQIRSPKIAEGRVALVGDAGYATPGFGTSLAIMGGYVLAGELLNHPGDVTAALRCYEELMLPYVKANQGGELGDYAMQLVNPQTAWGVSIRDTVLGLVTGLRLDKLAMTVSAWLGFSEKKLQMPDYPWVAR